MGLCPLGSMNFFFLFLLVTIASGCTQVKQFQNLDELLVLKDYSDEKEAQGKWIDQETKRFELILAAAKDGSIKDFSTQRTMREHFGVPVLIEHVQEGGASVERWLYRHPIQKLASDRVYIFFNSDGNLLRFENVVPSSDGQ